LTTPGLLQR